MPNLYKTRLCAEFAKRGDCNSGASCTYAHTAGELRASTPEDRAPLSPAATNP